MAISPSAAALAARSDPTWGGRAFGLRLAADFPLSWVLGPSGHTVAETTLHRVGAAVIDREWEPFNTDRLIDRRYESGELALSVDRHADGACLVHAPGYGRFLVFADGRLVLCELHGDEPWRWHRLLFAQVLPLAAALGRLELLHASAVVWKECTLAFVGAAGAGKTSLAAHLVAGGFDYLTDDVLAVELHDDQVIAHPGPGIASVHDQELAAVEAGYRRRFGDLVAQSDKSLLAVDMRTRPAPLAATCFIVRNADVADPALMPVRPPDPRLLLAASFLPHITDPARLIRHLDTCKRMSAAVACYRLLVPSGARAERVADAVRSYFLTGPGEL